MSRTYCKNCGEKAYDGACTNCHEEIYIERQYVDLDMPIPKTISDLADKHRSEINRMLPQGQPDGEGK